MLGDNTIVNELIRSIRHARWNVNAASPISLTHEISAATLLLWDASLMAEQEYMWIWKRPCPGILKGTFLLARYPPIFYQLANAAYVWRHLSRVPLPIPTSTCQEYFSFQLDIFKIFYLMLDTLIALKVTSVYKRNRPVAASMALCMALSTFTTFVCGPHILRGFQYDAACVPSISPVVHFSAVTCSALIRYAWKGHLLYQKHRLDWNKHFLWSTPNVDPFWFITVLGAIGVVFSVLPLESTYRLTGHAVFVWPITFISLLSTRLILSMRDTKGKNQSPRLEPVEVDEM